MSIQEGLVCPPNNGKYSVVELLDREVVVNKDNKVSKYPLTNSYMSIETNAHFLKRSAFVGKTADGTLFFVKYAQQAESPIISRVQSYALFDTTIVYTSGRNVSILDISSGDRKVVIESEEPIQESKILVLHETLVVICAKTIHRLNLATNLYTKIRLKVDLEINASGIAQTETGVCIAVSCVKGNIYVFDTQKMEMVKSIKSFGNPVSVIGFWKPNPSMLYVVTKNSELIDLDYLSNRLLKRVTVSTERFVSSLALKNKAILFISLSKTIMYVPQKGAFSVIYKSQNAGRVHAVYIVAEESEPDAPAEAQGILYQESVLQHAGAEKYRPKQEAPAYPAAASPTPDLAFTSSAKAGAQEWRTKTDENREKKEYSSTEIDGLYKSFESFKDSVYKMQTEVLKEVFFLKKKLEEIERTLTK